MKLQYEVHTDDYRGDHSADAVIAVEPKKDESLSDFAARVLSDYRTSGSNDLVPNKAFLVVRPVHVPEKT